MSFAGIIPEGVPAPSPTKCICCGNDRRPLATTGVTLPGWGVVHICIGNDRQPGCIMQLVSKAGFMTPGAAAQMQRDLDELTEQVAKLQRIVNRMPAPANVELVPAQEVVDALAARMGAPAKQGGNDDTEDGSKEHAPGRTDRRRSRGVGSVAS